MRTEPWGRRGGGSRRERRCGRWGIGWRSCGGGRGTRESRGSRRWYGIRGLRNGQRSRDQVHWAGRGVKGGRATSSRGLEGLVGYHSRGTK